MAAPLIIGTSINNISGWDFQTFSNKDLIAINQDVLGLQGLRIIGGILHNDGNLIYATASECQNTQDQLFKVQGNQIRNLDKNVCLKKDTKTNYLLFDKCEETEGVLLSLSFQLDEKNRILAENGHCVTLLPDGKHFALQPCDHDKRSDFVTLNQVENQDYVISSSIGKCLTATNKVTEPDTLNVWARQVSNGWGLLFFNNGDTAQSFNCDVTKCFSKMDIFAGTYIVKDLWSQTIIDFQIGKTFVVNNIPPFGGSASYSFIPKFKE